MFHVFIQDCNKKDQIEPFEKYNAKNTLEDEMMCLNRSAKNYIAQEQGLRRANEAIRDFTDLEKSKDKLEDGLYLTLPTVADCRSLDVCKITSHPVTSYFGTVSTVKNVHLFKRIFILNTTNVKIHSIYPTRDDQDAASCTSSTSSMYSTSKMTMENIGLQSKSPEVVSKYQLVQNQLRDHIRSLNFGKKC